MKPIVKEFSEEKPLREEITRLSELGIMRKDLYVMSRDEDSAKEAAKKTDSRHMHLKEDSLGSQVVNLLRQKDKVIHHRFKELGFSQSEAEQFEKKLAEGKLLLMIGDHKDPRGA